MKNIICYGDSNTFGFNPEGGYRYEVDVRWTGILAQILANKFKVIEEGCNNRTAFFINPDGNMQTGQKYLNICLERNRNFDIFILALGTNDLQKFFEIDQNIAREGLGSLVNIVKSFNAGTRIIIIPPVILSDDVLNGYFKCQFDENSIRHSIWIQKIYEEFAQKENCEFVDLNKHVKPSNFDGLHFDKNSHKIIAEVLAEKVLNLNVIDCRLKNFS